MRQVFVVLRVASPDRAWFWSRFASAAEAVVNSWGPRWARRRLVGRSIGVWVLTAAWMTIPLLVFTAGSR
jgi:hypothetical protein